MKIYLSLLVTILIVISSLSVFAADKPKVVKTKVFKQQSITCVKTNDKIKIDGIMDDAWKNSKVYSMYTLATKDKPLSKSECRTMYGDDAIYFFLKSYDKDVWALETELDGPTCLDDVLEVFLRTSPTCPWYYNFEINAIETAYHARNHVGGGGSVKRWSSAWNPKVKYAVHIEGTQNNPNDIDKYWTLELKVPYTELDTLNGKAPKPGDVWMVNLAKYDYSIYLPATMNGTELSTICVTDAGSYHELVNYCPMTFK